MPRTKKNKPGYGEAVELKLNIIRDARKAYEKAMKEHGKGLVKELATEFLTKFPEATGIKWRQYTPYFNDGDPCIFNVREPSVKVTPEFKASLSEEDFESYEDDNWIDYICSYDEKCDPRLKEISEGLDSLHITLQELEQALLESFGDHMEITILRDGKIHAEEHTHE